MCRLVQNRMHAQRKSVTLAFSTPAFNCDPKQTGAYRAPKQHVPDNNNCCTSQQQQHITINLGEQGVTALPLPCTLRCTPTALSLPQLKRWRSKYLRPRLVQGAMFLKKMPRGREKPWHWGNSGSEPSLQPLLEQAEPCEDFPLSQTRGSRTQHITLHQASE